MGLDTANSINNQNSPLTSSQRTGNFIRKINVARSINEVKEKFFFAQAVAQTGRGQFNGDPPLAFNRVGIQKLGLHFSRSDAMRKLQQSVGQGRFAVVNMGNNTKVPNLPGIQKSPYPTSEESSIITVSRRFP